MSTLDTVLDRLIRALATDNEQVFSVAIDTLADLGYASVPKLIEALSAPDRRVRLGAIAALAIIGPDATAAHSKLATLAEDEDDEIAEAARLALAAIATEDRDRSRFAA